MARICSRVPLTTSNHLDVASAGGPAGEARTNRTATPTSSISLSSRPAPPVARRRSCLSIYWLWRGPTNGHKDFFEIRTTNGRGQVPRPFVQDEMEFGFHPVLGLDPRPAGWPTRPLHTPGATAPLRANGSRRGRGLRLLRRWAEVQGVRVRDTRAGGGPRRG